MRPLLICTLLVTVAACAPTDYSWQFRYDTSRDDYSSDLEECKGYAAAQYRPGMPSGSPYLDEYGGYPHGYDWGGRETEFRTFQQGEWRPDRNPDRQTHVRTSPYHEVPREYTGYPSQLDYYPQYTDDILEKCMSDRGWLYRPEGSVVEQDQKER